MLRSAGYGQVLLVTHKSDPDEPVPVDIGDKVLVRGEYRFSETGGSINWTQRDYSARRRHGWIELDGKRWE